MNNTQYQALIAGYGLQNVGITGPGIIDGQGWDWWRNFTANSSLLFRHQRPKLVELVDCDNVVLTNFTARNSPFWTLHPIYCQGVRIDDVTILAPRDHGNTDGIDPSSCRDVLVTNSIIDVGDDAISVKAGKHYLSGLRVPARDYLFENVTILFRNFAVGSDVSGGVQNITFRNSVIGDDEGSSPWAIKLKTDSQEGGYVDGVTFSNVRLGNITFCGSSSFVFPKSCRPGHVQKATAIDMSMGYGLPPTNPGILRNIVFEGLSGIGPTGDVAYWAGLSPALNISHVTVRNVTLQSGGHWNMRYVDALTVIQPVFPPI